VQQPQELRKRAARAKAATGMSLIGFIVVGLLRVFQIKEPEGPLRDRLRHKHEFGEPAYFMGSTTMGAGGSGTSGGALPQEVREKPARAAIRPIMVAIFIVVSFIWFGSSFGVIPEKTGSTVTKHRAFRMR